ncbi:MAG: 16S rRNA (cytosine(1402)-N(4))-methyltransferase RsmH [Alphaproteobacteria bacterium]|nr:16S rRNA (cytosine(1402)-N(4))-methyltransferase RsmH [Alphaproteobacteria bacterium]
MSAEPFSHVPVMVHEAVAALCPREGGLYVDGTFGAGGYSRAFLGAARCLVVGVDRDPDAVARGRVMAEDCGGRLTIILGRYGDMADLLGERGISAVDGIALDLGVSSMQIDDPGRGFSFQRDGELDMRMGREGLSAADVVNTMPEAELFHIIRDYGEERMARRVARAIVSARMEAPITRTGRLASVVRSVVRTAADGIDPATRTFQGLRIHVNDELGELQRGLEAAERLLAPGGRLAVVAFHSLEDRVIKAFLKERSAGAPRVSRHLPEIGEPAAPSFRLLARRAERPAATEIAANPRARSARLRAAERTAAPIWTGHIEKTGQVNKIGQFSKNRDLT